MYKSTSILALTPPPIVGTTVHLTSPPPFKIKPEVFLTHSVFNVKEGDPVLAVPCAADGLPLPNVKWSAVGVTIFRCTFLIWYL